MKKKNNIEPKKKKRNLRSWSIRKYGFVRMRVHELVPIKAAVRPPYGGHEGIKPGTIVLLYRGSTP
jgi:hypothetical protein